MDNYDFNGAIIWLAMAAFVGIAMYLLQLPAVTRLLDSLMRQIVADDPEPKPEPAQMLYFPVSPPSQRLELESDFFFLEGEGKTDDGETHLPVLRLASEDDK